MTIPENRRAIGIPVSGARAVISPVPSARDAISASVAPHSARRMLWLSSAGRTIASLRLASRIGAKIALQEGSDCWMWKGAPRGDGYGAMRVRGQEWGIHRLVYTVMVGPIPDGLTIDHLCRRPLCVNPKHLEPVTKRENTLRGFGITAQEARRTQCPQGHPYDAKNTRTHRGKRYCRICQRVRGHERYWRMKGTSPSTPLGRQGVSSPHPLASHGSSTLPSAVAGDGPRDGGGVSPGQQPPPSLNKEPASAPSASR